MERTRRVGQVRAGSWVPSLEEPDRDRRYGPFGQLVRTFHQRTDNLELPLQPWRPLASSDQRLAESGKHYATDAL